LNDIALLPELLADESDGTDEFIEMLHSIARAQPSCQYIVEEFERVSTDSARQIPRLMLACWFGNILA
jgi:hypothetical protein